MNIEIIPWRDGIEPEPGKCYSGMPNETYHGFKDWWSSSNLKHTQRSVESFYYELEQPHKATLALERGSAFHVAMEGLATKGNFELFDSLVLECPTKTILTKAWQALKDGNPDCYALPEPEYYAVGDMAASLYNKAAPFRFFVEGWPELSFFWIDEETKFKLKCRPDWLRPDGDVWVVLDYKTSKNHQLEAFRKDVVNFGYHFSAAMYCEGVDAVTGISVENFRWLVVANTPPHECACYMPESFTCAEGYAQFRKSLRDIDNYEEPKGLADNVLEIPRWGFKET
jgi:exodeoxyribonuclease VIII